MASKEPGSGNSGLPMGRASERHYEVGQRALQFLAIRANFSMFEIIGFDSILGRRIYRRSNEELQEGEVHEEMHDEMVNLVPFGPRGVIDADAYFRLSGYIDETGPPIFEEVWDVSLEEEITEYVRTICAGLGRKLEITYLLIPSAIEANVEVKLKLKDLYSRTCHVYGKIKASATEYGNKSVHLFNCERGKSLSFPSPGSPSILPLSPSVVAVRCGLQIEVHIEVDLTVITTCDGQEEEHKNLKFCLEFTHEIIRQEREVDGDGVEVEIDWAPVGR